MAEHEAEQQPTTVFPIDEVRELIALMKASDIAEVLIKRGDDEIQIRRTSATPAPTVVAVPGAPAPLAYPAPTAPTPLPTGTPDAAAGAAPAEEATSTGITVTAPMVGTFYAAPSPKEPPYVQVGDEVRPGDVLGIIEAMKIMNEIECEVHGRVARMLVQNGQPVEYGQPLMVIEPF